MPKVNRPVLILLGAAALVIAIVLHWSDIAFWVQGEQRAIQTQLAKTIHAVRAGDQFAVAALLGACFLYGLLHAIGPGHGKFLIGSAAIASRSTAWRMATIGFSSSLMQAVSAVLLAYGGLGLVSLTGSAVIGSANTVLVPLSYAAMALVGAWIAVRGFRLIAQQKALNPGPMSAPALATASHHPHHNGACDHTHDAPHAFQAIHGPQHNHADGQCAAGCRHLPTVHEAESLEGWRDIVTLVLSIGLRPCSGALIVLIISWHFGLLAVGALGTVAMAVGTGLVVALVALFATTVRESGLLRLTSGGEAVSLATFGRLQMVAGSLVVVACLAAMATGVTAPAPTGLVR